MATPEEILAKAKALYDAGDVDGAKRLAKIAKSRMGGGGPQYAPNGVPMNAAAKAEIAAKAKAGTLPLPSAERMAEQAAIDQSAADQMTIGNGARAGLSKFVQGLPFVGEYSDEATGMIGNAVGWMTGDAGLGDRAMAAQRADQEAMDREYPKTSLGLQIAGGITGSIPLAAAAGPKLLATAKESLMGKAIVGAVAGSTAGGGEGFVSGYGAGNDGDRMQSAKERGMVGAGLGAAIGGIAPFAAAGVEKLAKWAKGYDTKIIAKVLGVDKKTANMIKAGFDADDPAAALAALDRAGPDAMLADAGPGMGRLLDASMQSSGPAARIASKEIEGRAAKAATRLNNIFDNLLGQADEGMKSAAKAIAQKTASARSAAYEKAFAVPINYADDAGRAIEDVVARVPDDIMARAVKAANDSMRIEGRVNKNIMASIADDGTVTFSKPLDLFQLNELKVKLGELGRAAVDQFGRPTGEGRRIKSLEVQLAKALGDAVPEYRAAVKMGGDKIAEDMGLDLGRKMLSPSVTREQVVEQLRGAADDAVAAAKRGLRNYLDETMANVRAVISDPNVDAREAMKVVKDLSSKASRQKVTSLLGAQKADALFDTIEEATAHLELRAAVARNSATASRQAIQGQATAEVGDTVLDAARDGEAINFAKRIVQTVTGGSSARKQAALNQLYTEVSKALTGPRGAEAKAAMAVIEKALSGQAIKTEEAEAIARLLTTGGALALHQTGTKYLAPR